MHENMAAGSDRISISDPHKYKYLCPHVGDQNLNLTISDEYLPPPCLLIVLKRKNKKVKSSSSPD